MRGDSAEWCEKCKRYVMPVITGNGAKNRLDRWCCPLCYTSTQEKK